MGNVKLANMLKALAEVELRQYEMDKTIESLRQDQESKITVCREQLRNCWAREKDEEYFCSIGFWRLLGKTLLAILKAFFILAGVGLALTLLWTVLTFVTLGMLYRFLEKIVYFSLALTFLGTAVVAVLYPLFQIAMKYLSKSELEDIRSEIAQWIRKIDLIPALYQRQIEQIECEKAKFQKIAGQMQEKIRAEHHLSIYYKYNNPVALAKFAEYLESGRCDGLEGPYGAYNLYESERSMNAIVEKLDDLSKNLAQAMQGQFALYQGMQAMMNRIYDFSRDVSAACDRMESLEKNVKLQAYYSELHARQQEYTNYALGVRDYGTGFVTYR